MFEHRTFEPGEPIDWDDGVFVLDPDTGLIDGYRVQDGDIVPGYYWRHSGGWITFGNALLHTVSGDSWVWPHRALEVVTASREHVLFERVTPLSSGARTTDFIIANAAMEEIRSFSLDLTGDTRSGLFSPDGQRIALGDGEAVYLVPVPPGRPTTQVLANAEGYVDASWDTGPTERFRVRSFFGPGHPRLHYYDWSGAALGNPACSGGWLSPDGAYIAWIDPGPTVTYEGAELNPRTWPSITFADAETCEPLYRIRSAHADLTFWIGEWLPTSERVRRRRARQGS